MEDNTLAKNRLEAAGSRVTGSAVKASAQLLTRLEGSGRTGKDMPIVMNAFFSALGGKEAYGKLLHEHFMKALGDDLTPAEADQWGTSPKLIKDWFDLLSRHVDKNDQGKTLDVGSLDEADLDSILAEVAKKRVLEDPLIRRAALWAAMAEDPEFRKAAFHEALRYEPGLGEEFLRNGGIITLEHTPLSPEVIEDYDPTADEYKV